MSTFNILPKHQERFSQIATRLSYYFKSLVWSFIVLVILFLPYLCSSFVDYLTSVECEELMSFFEEFMVRVRNGVNNGGFLFIPISLASGSYIDYLFERKLKKSEYIVHTGFYGLLLLVVGTYVCIDLFNQIAKPSFFSLKRDVVDSFVVIVFVFSFTYALGVKALVINFRDNKTTSAN